MKVQEIPAGGSWSGIVKRGEVLKIVDVEGQQGVDFLCYSADNPEERYHAANTMKRAAAMRLTATSLDFSCMVHCNPERLWKCSQEPPEVKISPAQLGWCAVFALPTVEA